MSRQWPLGSEVKRKDLTGGAMLYDASRAGNAAASWFEPSFWQERGELDGEAHGRGTVYLTKSVTAGVERGVVLRHYHRGGLIAQLSRDRYIWRGPFETRAFREWQLLYHLHRAGLPVPTPVAARYQRHGLTYSADLITERLMDSQSLASVLRVRGIPILGWITIGRCIRTFHDLGVCHADLNAHNILLVGDDSVYLVDFDRGRLMKPGLWCDSNLVRLRRSLEKITYKLPPENFSEADWHGLLDGYRQPAGAARANGAGVGGSAPVSAPSPAVSDPPTTSLSVADDTRAPSSAPTRTIATSAAAAKSIPPAASTISTTTTSPTTAQTSAVPAAGPTPVATPTTAPASSSPGQSASVVSTPKAPPTAPTPRTPSLPSAPTASTHPAPSTGGAPASATSTPDTSPPTPSATPSATNSPPAPAAAAASGTAASTAPAPDAPAAVWPLPSPSTRSAS